MIGRQPWKSRPLIFAQWMLQSPKQTAWIKLSSNSNSEIYILFKEEEEKDGSVGCNGFTFIPDISFIFGDQICLF